MKRTLILSLAIVVLAAFASAAAITLDVKEHVLSNGTGLRRTALDCFATLAMTTGI